LTVESVRDVAVIVIAVLHVVLLLVLAVAAFFLLRGAVWLDAHVRGVLDEAREVARSVESRADATAEQAAHALIRVSALCAAAGTFLRVLVKGPGPRL
jgi:flagellar basal body-associated protein FliL